ncbi:NEW3 domain-containing protein [Pseudonocardia pini]|uniref:NEW3 domain-containing protein n=1 Tax=Pseudonocardia pini TaxID=2758030 RepID=UPI0015EFE918|nr:NEW3 domain-containing protein [Pseudonocardia pini]
MTRTAATTRRIAIIGALTAVGFGAVSVATAAVLLTTSVTGTATIKTVPAPAEPKIALSASGTQNEGLDCRQVGVSADYTTLTLKPVLTRTEGQAAATETCTLTFRLRNVGTVPVRLDVAATTISGPSGWTASAPDGDATADIAPGAVKTATVTVTAAATATEGAFSGQLVYVPGSAAAGS